jgi:hypothetical protein
MAESNQPVMLSYRCPDRRAPAVRTLLAAYQPAGVRFQEQPVPWWARLFGNWATFSIRCPAFYVERLHDQLADRGRV